MNALIFAQEWNHGSYGISTFNLLRNCWTLLQSSCKKISFPSAVHEDSNSSTFPPTLVIIFFPYSGDNFENESEYLLVTSGRNKVCFPVLDYSRMLGKGGLLRLAKQGQMGGHLEN